MKLLIKKYITLQLLLAAAGVHAFAQNADEGAVISIARDSGQTVHMFRPGEALFPDRSAYRIAECPDWLQGKRFLRGSINSTRFDVVKDGLLLVLTPQPLPRAASLSQDLEDAGFRRLDEPPFQLFGDKEIDKVLVYAKNVAAGESYTLGKWAVVLGFSEIEGELDRTRVLDDKPYSLYPSDIPNTGIMLVDQEKDGRSGHGGITLTECANGDILAFYSVTWAETMRGHSIAGWSQYKRSTDGGLTWSDPIVFGPSKQMWDGRAVFSGLVYSVITAPNGTLVATVVRYANAWWVKQLPPIYYLSYDHGETWSEPRNFDDAATVDDISMTMSTHFVHDGKIFIVFRGGPSNMSPGGKHSLWVSEDSGETFQQRSVLPFHDSDYYWAAGALDDGEIIVYTYNGHHDNGRSRRDGEAEKNIPYVISRDGGYTWSEVKTTYFAKAIRNMQMSDKLGDYYFMHGRSGGFSRELAGDDPGPGNFVLYYSKDGINWDEGIIMMSRMLTPGGGDNYSSNVIVGKYDPDLPERLMILSDISYDGPRTNMHYWFLGTEAGALDYLKEAGAVASPSRKSGIDHEGVPHGGDDLGATLADEDVPVASEILWGFTTQNFGGLIPVSLETAKDYVRYAERVGFEWIELRDPDASLTVDECREIAKLAESLGIRINYSAQRDLLAEDFWEIFDRALVNTAVFDGPQFVRILALRGEGEKGWTEREFQQMVAIANAAVVRAAEHGVGFTVENADAALDGRNQPYYGMIELLEAIDPAVTLQLDTANLFTGPVELSPVDAEAFIRQFAPRISYLHLKSAHNRQPLPVIDGNPLDFDTIFSLLESRPQWVAIELAPNESADQVYAAMEAALDALAK
jgi:sugar phosphate isomerase/epimerase